MRSSTEVLDREHFLPYETRCFQGRRQRCPGKEASLLRGRSELKAESSGAAHGPCRGYLHSVLASDRKLERRGSLRARENTRQEDGSLIRCEDRDHQPLLPREAFEFEIDLLPCLRLESAPLGSGRRRDLALEESSQSQERERLPIHHGGGLDWQTGTRSRGLGIWWRKRCHGSRIDRLAALCDQVLRALTGRRWGRICVRVNSLRLTFLPLAFMERRPEIFRDPHGTDHSPNRPRS